MPGIGGGDRRRAESRLQMGSGGGVFAAVEPGKASLAPLQPFEQEGGQPQIQIFND